VSVDSIAHRIVTDFTHLANKVSVIEAKHGDEKFIKNEAMIIGN
jgi:hypothetical protein